MINRKFNTCRRDFYEVFSSSGYLHSFLFIDSFYSTLYRSSNASLGFVIDARRLECSIVLYRPRGGGEMPELKGQELALHTILAGENVFVTGGGGVDIEIFSKLLDTGIKC